MVLNKLTAYDLIVDIIPGFLFIILIYPIFPQESLNQLPLFQVQAFQGIMLIAASYPVGRILHGVGSISGSLLIGARRRLVRVLEKIYSETENRNGDTLTRRLTVNALTWGLDTLRYAGINSQEDYILQTENIDRNEDENEPLIKQINVSKNIYDDVIRSLNSELSLDLENEDPDEVKALTRYGHHLLYPKDTLYRKYQILHTFYKNISTGLFIVGIIYLGKFIYSSNPSGESRTYLALLGSLLILISFVAILRQDKWRKSTHRAFFNDLHLELGG